MIVQDQIISRSSGDQNSSSQYMFQNIVIQPSFGGTQFYEYHIPTFNPSGASFDYYSQNVSCISVSLNNSKLITFNWIDGTSSLSGNNTLRQEVYQLPFNDYSEFLNSTGTTQQMLVPVIQRHLTEPFVTIDLPATGVTNSNSFDYFLPQIVKPNNNYAQQLFVDKSQYFIDTKLIFNRNVDNTLGNFIYETPFSPTSTVPVFTASTGQQQYVYFDGDGFITGITPSILGQFETVISEGHQRVIASGSTPLVSGMTINGAYFVYFSPPHKPNVKVVNNAPSVLGLLDTFTPIFDFNTVDDGDYYKLQVNYDINDVSFTGNRETIFTIPQQQGDPNYIRSYSTPLTPASEFIYRIGNTKEIINIFGVKQSVTTWGEIYSAYTANDGKFNVSGYVYQTYYSSNSPVNPNFGGIPVITGATISFYVVTNTSAVDLGADVVNNNSILGAVSQSLGGGVGSTFSAITDANGYYEISQVPGGYSQVTVSSPLSISGNSIFSSTTQIINVNQDIGNNFNLSIYWGNNVLTFVEFENYPFV